MNSQEALRHSNSISVLLLKLQSLEILIPKVMVMDVLTWNENLFNVQRQSNRDWWLGEYEWQGQNVPLVCFEQLLQTKSAKQEIQKRKIVILKAGDNEHYALHCRGFPKPLILSQESLDNLAKESVQDWIAYSVLIGSRELNIPDLPALETLIYQDQSLLHQTA